MVIGGRSNFEASSTVPDVKQIFVASIVPERSSPVMKLNRLMSVPVWLSCAAAEHAPLAPVTPPSMTVDALPTRRTRSPANTRPSTEPLTQPAPVAGGGAPTVIT